MDGAIGMAAVALAGAPIAVGLVGISSRLEPIARVIDVRRPAVVISAVSWAVIVPSVVTMLAGALWLTPSALFAWGGLAIALVDLAALRAPHGLSLGLGLTGAALAALVSSQEALVAVVTALCCFGFMHAARLGFRKARGFDGMGGGDPIVMAALGAWSGPVAAPWLLACACVLGLAMAAAVPSLHQPRARLPFSPLLVGGATIVAIVRAGFTASPFWTMGIVP